MTPKTEAASLGEQIKQALYTSNGRHACDHPSQYAATADCEKLIDRLVALATIEPRLTPVGAGDGNTYVVHERPVVRGAAPQAVGERLPLTDEDFETWWQQEGQFGRAGGGDYEKTFAFNSWNAAIKALKEPT